MGDLEKDNTNIISEFDKQLPKHKKGIKIINPETGHIMYVRSIYEIPNGYVLGNNKYSDESREKMSQSAKKRGAPVAAFRDKKGRNNPMYGKKLSEASKHKISETKKMLKNGVCGKKVYHNVETGQIKYFSPEDEIPEGFVPGRK